MKVPKALIVQLIKRLYPDKEKQKVMLEVLNKLDLNSLQSTEDVAKALQEVKHQTEPAAPGGNDDGSNLCVDNEIKAITSVKE